MLSLNTPQKNCKQLKKERKKENKKSLTLPVTGTAKISRNGMTENGVRKTSFVPEATAEQQLDLGISCEQGREDKE